MLLSLDIGNSAVKGGFFDKSDLHRVFSVSLDSVDRRGRSAVTAWTDALRPHLRDTPVEQVGLASVVPSTADAVTDALVSLTETSATGASGTDAFLSRIHPTMPLPFELAYETPDTLGSDRLAAAAAGWMQFGQPASRSVLVIDAGTAITCEVIHREGIYQGGTIGAGPVLARQALQSGTAQLPAVPLSLPEAPVGRSTQAALQSGIMWSLVDSVHGMTDRLAATLPDDPVIVLTGGWSTLLANHLELHHHAPHLVLHGIRLLVTETD